MAIKNLTYHNLMRVAKMVQAKGYDQKEAVEIAKQRFAEFNPLGMSIEAMVKRMPTKAEWEEETKMAEKINMKFTTF